MSEKMVDERFPNMTPISGPPPLFRLNGCGVGIYGTRDRDAKTNTYITTYCISLVWFPVFPLCAYRISDAPSGGWYFLGKEPLSLLPRLWRGFACTMIALTLAAGFYDTIVNSPEKRAERALRSARALIAANRTLEGARELARLTGGRTDASLSARHELAALITRDLDRVKLPEVAALLKLASAGVKKDALPGLDAAIIYQRGLAVLARAEASDARSAMAIGDALAPLAPDPAAHARRHEALVKSVYEQNKGDATVAVQYATVVAEAHDPARVLAILEPHAKVLKDEGARLLGQAYGESGKTDEAIALLDTYVQPRLYVLRERARHYEEAVKDVEDQAVSDMKHGRVPSAFFKDFEHADKAEKKELVAGFIRQRLKNDVYTQTTLESLREGSTVIPVALELGALRLRRAASLADPAARKAELLAAEKAFLGISQVAGEYEGYRLYYGQVCFWLGRPAEGQKLFDELLAMTNRSPAMLALTADTLRQVGDVVKARALYEEAYASEKDEAKRQKFASARAALQTGDQDGLAWLERAGSDFDTRAQLAMTRARRATVEGKPEEAAAELARAIAIYDAQPRSAGGLNNAAVASFELAQVTADDAMFAKAAARLEEALAMAPSNSVLLRNSAMRQYHLGLRQTMPAGLLPKLSESEPGTEHLPLLYDDLQSREAVGVRLMANPAIKLAVARLEKLLLISPKDTLAYHTLAALLVMAGDAKSFHALTERARAANVDISDESESSNHRRTGKLDEETRRTLRPAAARLTAILSGGKLDGSPMSYAMAAQRLVFFHVALEGSGDPIPADALLPLCEKAMKLVPSVGTFILWREVSASRALARLATDPRAAKLDAAMRRDILPSGRLLLTLWKVPALRDRARSDADLARLLSAWRARAEAMPGDGWGYDAMVMWLHDPAKGQLKLAAERADTVNRLDVEVSRLLDRNNVSRCVSDVLTALIDRGEESAVACFSEAAKRGVAIPAGLSKP